MYQGEALRGGIEGEGGGEGNDEEGEQQTERVARDDGGERVLTGE